MSWSVKGRFFDTCSCELMCLRQSVRVGDEIDFEVEDIVPKRSSIDAFGIQYEDKSGLSTAEFSWAA